MAKVLSEHQLKLFHEYEPKLKRAALYGLHKEALKMVLKLREAMMPDKRHHRLLQANCHYYDALINAGLAQRAIPGLESILDELASVTPFDKVSAPVTYLEANMLLSICYIRARNRIKAVPLIHYVINHYHNTSSKEKRRRLQKDYIERLQHEAILAHMIVPKSPALSAQEVQNKAQELINLPQDEVYTALENTLPSEAKQLMLEVTSDTVPLLTAEDRLALPGPIKNPSESTERKPVVTTLHELGWRLVCDPDAIIYKAWIKDPTILYVGISSWVAKMFNQWDIPAVLLAGGLTSEILRGWGKGFCENHKPASLLITRKDLNKKL